jgi:hypothetical protein
MSDDVHIGSAIVWFAEFSLHGTDSTLWRFRKVEIMVLALFPNNLTVTEVI